jgi:tocopherol O-methyltransferase
LRILDVGCGIGGSSIYLARNLGAQVTGITVSPVQVEMARTAAKSEGVDVSFRVMDAQNMSFAPNQQFDCIWSIEAISHFHNKKRFFDQASNLLVPGGVIAITDWFGKRGLSDSGRTEYLEPIERGMLIELNTLEDYLQIMADAGTVVQETGNLSENVAQTWDFCLDIIEDKSLWQIAHEFGEDFVHFLDSFAAMKRGYEAKALEYQLIISRKP